MSILKLIVLLCPWHKSEGEVHLLECGRVQLTLRILINYSFTSLLLNMLQMHSLRATILSIFLILLFRKKTSQNFVSFQKNFWDSISRYESEQFILDDFWGILWFNLLGLSLTLILLLHFHLEMKIIWFLFLVSLENEYLLRYRDISRYHKLNFQHFFECFKLEFSIQTNKLFLKIRFLSGGDYFKN